MGCRVSIEADLGLLNAARDGDLQKVQEYCEKHRGNIEERDNTN